jgi:uncharacterized protein with NRDE domain
MCIILFAYKANPKYNLVLAANRDEYFARPTAHAAFWEDAPDILAGRDLERGGTWLGVSREGRYAAVTNFRDASTLMNDAPSRGFLVSDFLRSDKSPADYLDTTASLSANHNGFNLIVGDRQGLFYHSNRDRNIRALAPGIYGLSNHLLDTPWPKVEKGKQALAELVHQGAEIAPDAVFDILADRAQAGDALLPHTGISVEYERALSPIFISTPVYGTRSSTLLLIDLEDRITFIERTFEMSERETDAFFQFGAVLSVPGAVATG